MVPCPPSAASAFTLPSRLPDLLCRLWTPPPGRLTCSAPRSQGADVLGDGLVPVLLLPLVLVREPVELDLASEVVAGVVPEGGGHPQPAAQTVSGVILREVLFL